jgi:hypothetical protein
MRARNIKPGFFASEQLSQVPPLTRILFAGLWCLADREGKLRDRPARIRAEVLPYESEHDPEAALQELGRVGVISRYVVDGEKYIKILGFSKHQNPHPREVPSEIPEPNLGITQAQPRHNPGNAQATPSNCLAGLIPGSSDSPSLIPGSSDSGSQIKPAHFCERSPNEASDSSRQEVITESKPKKKDTDPRFAPLRLAWEQTFAQNTREEYRWQGAKDAKAIHNLIAIEVDEFRVRADRGLRAQGFAHCSTVAMLASKWNELAGQTLQRSNSNGRAKEPSGPHFIPPAPVAPPTGLPEWDAILAHYAERAPGTRDELSAAVTPSLVSGVLRLEVPDEYRAEYVSRHIEDIRAACSVPVMIQVAGCEVPF